tara:strand:+ start:1401 stop:2276 length:876 start_codon:yes stop_codon:yes gene_type:complete
MPTIWRPNLWIDDDEDDDEDDDDEEEDDGLGTDDDDDDMAPVRSDDPVRSGEVREAVEGDVTEAARKQGGWVGKKKRNTERKGGGWQSGTPREVDDDRTGPGGEKASNQRGIFTHLPRTSDEALSQFHRRLFVETKRYRFLMVMMTHAASCRDSTSCRVWKCDSVKRHLRHARECANPACTNRVCPHVKFLLHHRRECADGDGCYVCAAARKREKMEFTVIGDDDDEDEERAKKEGEKGVSTGVRWSTRVRGCLNCGRQKTPQWRVGPEGPKTLCNACGVRFRKELPVDGP